MPIRYLNLTLLILFPVSWFAPLLRAGIDLPLFGLSEVSVISGVLALWESDRFLAMIVCLFALVAPYLKTIGIALIHHHRLGPRMLPVLNVMGKLAMADVFLIALYIIIVKGVSLTRIETSWGLYLFTACILTSIAISYLTARKHGSGLEVPDTSAQ